VRYDDSVKLCGLGSRDGNRKGNCALFVEEYPFGKPPNPTFCSPHLMGRSRDCASVPATPGNFKVILIAELTVFVTEDDDVIIEDDE
jgi:hypothetical protein